MKPTDRSKLNVAARAGAWSAAHRKTAIFGWIAFVAVAIALGSLVGTRHIHEARGTGESAQAIETLNSALPKRADEQVLVQSGTLTVADPGFKAAVNDVVSRLNNVAVARDVRSPLMPGSRQAVSRDGHSALVQFHIDGGREQTKEAVAGPLAATAAAQRSHPGFRIEQAGGASAARALDKSSGEDFARAQTLSLPLTLVILVLAFGSLVAAGIPVLLAISGVGATLGLVALVSQIGAVAPEISEIVLLIGMAVGVDYSLFYLRRVREERAAGRGHEAAVQAAAATSGRSVLISGITVMVAMSGLVLTGDPIFTSLAVGTVLVVAVAVLASLTVLPALLSALGDRTMKGRVPFAAGRRQAGESRMWGAVVERVLRRPRLSAGVAAGVLIALSIPAFGLHTANPGLQGLPQRLPIVHTLNSIETAFPGGPQPASVVVRAADVGSPEVSGAIRSLQRRALASGEAHEPITTTISPDRTVALVSIPLAGRGTDAASDRALTALRRELIPATIGRVSGARAFVAGPTAMSKDFNELIGARSPIVFAFVLGMVFLLLLVTFRSIVIPIKAIVLNLLSVGAAYGVLVLVFQSHWAESLLGFKSTGAIAPWLPLFLFVILFSLSADYHVFILSRIREAVDRGMSTESAVAHGIKSTAGVVTSAAVVMVGVFSIFATLGSLELKQMGVGLAVAILIDATIVRAVLLPATMKLLGDWNWYLPSKLTWLPRIAQERPAQGRPRPEPIPA